MRVFFVTEQFLPTINGAVTASRQLAEQIALCGSTVALCAPTSEDLLRWGEKHGITVVGLPALEVGVRYTRIVTRPGRQTKLLIRNAIQSFDPHIVHAHSPMVAGSEALRYAVEAGIVAIATQHLLPENLVAALPPSIRFVSPVLKKALWGIIRKRISIADLVSVPTVHAKALYVHAVSPHRISVISNGVMLDVKRKYARKDTGMLTGLYVGRLDAEKNVSQLLRAAALVQRKGLKFELRIVGDGAERMAINKLRDRLGTSDSVHILGKLTDSALEAEYSSADIFLMASRVELQCCAALEAMSYGCPIVAVNAGALPETMTRSDGSIAGILCPTDSANDLAEAIVAMSEESIRRRYGEIALQRAHEHELSSVASTWTKVYAELVNTCRYRGAGRETTHSD